jgi:hypothetical protein
MPFACYFEEFVTLLFVSYFFNNTSAQIYTLGSFRFLCCIFSDSFLVLIFKTTSYLQHF